MKRNIKFWVFLVVAGLAGISVTTGCDSRAGEVDMEKQQWLYLVATMPKSTDLQGICLNDQNTALACAADSGIPGVQAIYMSTMESVYSITVPAPRDAAALCSVLTVASTYPNPTAPPNTTYTVGAKACFFNCDQDYWKRMRNGGACTATNYSTLIPTNDTTYQGCLKVCLGQGTLLPQ